MNKIPDWLRLPILVGALVATAILIAVLPSSIGRTIIGIAFTLVMVAIFGERFLWACFLAPIVIIVLILIFKGH